MAAQGSNKAPVQLDFTQTIVGVGWGSTGWFFVRSEQPQNVANNGTVSIRFPAGKNNKPPVRTINVDFSFTDLEDRHVITPEDLADSISVSSPGGTMRGFTTQDYTNHTDRKARYHFFKFGPTLSSAPFQLTLICSGSDAEGIAKVKVGIATKNGVLAGMRVDEIEIAQSVEHNIPVVTSTPKFTINPKKRTVILASV